ncbi:MAG: lytic transglycosylase [Burkholderiales bacterium RIFOXYC12_FULL_65_23]|uniref:lytic transglycosylase domain-containing protein n=1 Tax=Malikia spinosa TaxID=86180 RepID=UPI0008C63E22|nr:MAG: lytic transglycosylase [Burkholderiales bacterium RIFOXYC12_FULL_65_23]
MCIAARVLGAGFLLPAAAWATCWDEAGRGHGIDPLLLKAIAWKESRGWTGAVGPRLRDGNRALGLMQINTIHLPSLARFGIGREQLFDACTSQKVGAWVLANCIQRFGATWKAVGCYYAGPASTNHSAQAAYVRDVQRFYEGYRWQAAAAPVQVASLQGQ